jgi:hypothetical protein
MKTYQIIKKGVFTCSDATIGGSKVILAMAKSIINI